MSATPSTRVGRLMFVACAGLLVIATACSSSAPFAQKQLAPGVATPTEAERQNIVVIMTDDMREDELATMPHTRRLLERQGTRFTNAVHSNPLCCPARAQFLTGQYSHNNGVWSNAGAHGGFKTFDRIGGNEDTLPVWLQAAGYHTVMVGKYLNGYATHGNAEPEPGWTEWKGAVRPLAYMNYALSHDGKVKSYRGSYLTHELNRISEDVIEERADETEPFFLWISHTAPHTGSPGDPDDPRTLRTPYVAPRDRDTSRAHNVDNPSFCETDVSDKPAHIQALRTCDRQLRQEFRELRQQRIESLRAVDRGVKSVVDSLRKTGQLDETTIVFTSDNGFSVGEHRRFGKRLPAYEHNTQNPLVIRGSDFPNGHQARQRATMVDITATILDVAGIWRRQYCCEDSTHPIDGRTLIPLATHPEVATNRPILLEGGGYAARDARVPRNTGVRVDNWVYVRYVDGQEELYNLATDPYQVKNLADDPRWRARKRRLRALTARFRVCSGSDCRRHVRRATSLTSSHPTNSFSFAR